MLVRQGVVGIGVVGAGVVGAGVVGALVGGAVVGAGVTGGIAGVGAGVTGAVPSTPAAARRTSPTAPRIVHNVDKKTNNWPPPQRCSRSTILSMILWSIVYGIDDIVFSVPLDVVVCVCCRFVYFRSFTVTRRALPPLLPLLLALPFLRMRPAPTPSSRPFD